MKKAILAVYIGSTYPDAEKAYNNIEAEIRKKLPDAELTRAYTSKAIREKLAKQGIHIDSVAEALEKMAADKVDHVAVLPCMIFPSNACMAMMADFMIHNEKFPEGISLFRVLLDLAKDYEIFVNVFFEKLIPAERKNDEAVVLVAHSSILQLRTLKMLLMQRDGNIFVSSRADSTLCEKLKTAGIKKAYLIPLMIAAGIHVQRDIAAIKIDDIECVPVLKGLGENDRIAQIIASHII
jgi:sirohydrochlorin cobaltochelatase